MPILPANSSIDEKKRDAFRNALLDTRVWLLDTIAGGIAVADTHPPDFWLRPAARLTDSGAKGASDLLREIATYTQKENDTDKRHTFILTRLADLYLLMRTFERIETLSEDAQAAAMITAGWNVTKKTLLGNPDDPTHDPNKYARLADMWQVVGQTQAPMPNNEAVKYRRTWLWGVTNQIFTLVLEFNFGDYTFEGTWQVGTQVTDEVIFYPDNGYRVLPVPAAEASTMNTTYTTIPATVFFGYENFSIFHALYRAEIARSPFRRETPCALMRVTPIRHEGIPYFLDDNQTMIPIAPLPDGIFTTLLMMSGGHPLAVFGEWNGYALSLFTVFENGTWWDVVKEVNSTLSK